MPMYQYCCTECGKEMDVIRTFDESSELPTLDEVKEANVPTCHAVGGHNWHKRIGNPHIVKGAGWRGSKGSW